MNAPMRTDWARVGGGFSVRFSLNAGRLDAMWLPRVPTKREFRRVLDRYRDARGVFLAEVGRRIGGTVACVELPT